MTTELEEQFFKVFGIEKECVRGCGEYYLENGNFDAWNVFDCKNSDCSKCKHDKSIWKYPEITDRVLLKLIIIAMNYGNRYRWINDTSNIEELKSETLELLIKLDELLPHIKHQIQQLFKEEE